MKKVDNSAHNSNNCIGGFSIRKPSYLGLWQKSTSYFLTENIIKMCTQGLGFNKINNFYCLIKGILMWNVLFFLIPSMWPWGIQWFLLPWFLLGNSFTHHWFGTISVNVIVLWKSFWLYGTSGAHRPHFENHYALEMFAM